MHSFRVLLIAEDSVRDVYRSAIRQSYQLIGETSDYDAGIFLAASLKADLIIIGYGYSLDRALGVAENLLDKVPTAAVVLMGEAIDQEELVRVMQAGVREFLPAPDPEELVSSIRRTHIYLERLRQAKGISAERPMGKVLAIHSPKGGSGKSFLAANLAIALHQVFRQDVAVVDLAFPFGGQDLLFNLQGTKSVADLANISAELDLETVLSTLANHASGVSLLMSPSNPEEAETVTATEIEPMLQSLRSYYGWVVIDTSSELNELNLRVLELADKVVVPFFPDLVHLRHIQRSLKLWEQLRINCGKVSFCRWGQKGDVDEEAAEKVFKKSLAFRLPFDSVAAHDSINQGVPLILQQPNHALSKGFREMAASLTGAVAALPKNDRFAQLWHMLRRFMDVSAQQA